MPADSLILSFDLGTTRLKAALFDQHGALRGQVSRRHREYHKGDQRWQEADAWWRDCIDATAELLALSATRPPQVAGITLSGRAGAAVFLDETGGVVENPWSDNRHLGELRNLVGERIRTEYALYGATLLSKAMWLRSNDPSKWRQVRYVLYAKDTLMFRLTGEAVTDPSSGPDGVWDTSLMADSGISIDTLPRPEFPWTIGGTVTARAAKELGILAGTPVAVGAHDGICANVGAGAVEPSRYALTLGTHAVARTVVDENYPGFLRFYGFPPNRHVLGGNALMAGRSLDWFVDTWVSPNESRRQEIFAELEQEAAGVEPGAGGAMFLPYLGGRIAPERRPDARAAFQGLSVGAGRREMYRAVLEGTAFAIADMFDQLTEAGGKPSYVGLTGSGVRSDCWTGVIADILDETLSITDEATEGRGAAAFCATALGHYPTLRDAIANMVEVTGTVNPDPARVETYRQLRRQWLDFKRALDAA